MAGGRVRTVREFDDGLHAEAGATRIPVTHQRTIELVRQCGLGLEPFHRESPVIYAHGRLLRPDDEMAIAAAFEFGHADRALGIAGIHERLHATIRDALGDPRDPEWPRPEQHVLDALSGADLIRSWGLSPAVTEWLDMGGASLSQHGSALHLLREMALNESPETLRIAGGNDLLPRALAAQLGERVRFGLAVRRIEHGDDGVRITVEQVGDPGGATHEIAASRVILTMPLTVARHVAIDPPLSAGTMRAIRELHYSSVCRLFVQTRSRPWALNGARAFAVTDVGLDVFDSSDGLPGSRGVLTAYLRDAAARALMAMNPPSRHGHIVSLLECIFPGVARAVERTSYFSWDEDPWARGALADFLPGQVSELYPHLRRFEGRVHLAGEHTSPWAGWMQGAIESGERVADQVLQQVADAP